MHRALSDDPSGTDGLPGTRDAVAQNLLLFEMAGGDNEFDRLTTYDYDVVRLMAYAPELSGPQYDELSAGEAVV